MKYSFTVQDPSEVDFARIIKDCGEEDVIMLVDDTDRLTFLISTAWLATFAPGDNIRIWTENVADKDFGFSHIRPKPYLGGIVFDVTSEVTNIPGYRAVRGKLEEILRDISTARAFIPRRKVTVEVI